MTRRNYSSSDSRSSPASRRSKKYQYLSNSVSGNKINKEDLIGKWQNINSYEISYLYKQGDNFFWLESDGWKEDVIQTAFNKGYNENDSCFCPKESEIYNERYIELFNKYNKLHGSEVKMLGSMSTGSNYPKKYNPSKDVIVEEGLNYWNKTIVYKRINKVNIDFNMDELIMRRIYKEQQYK